MRNAGAVALVRKGESQEKIATTIGVSRVAVSGWINGKKKPLGPKREALLAAYGIALSSWDEAPPKRPAKVTARVRVTGEDAPTKPVTGALDRAVTAPLPAVRPSDGQFASVLGADERPVHEAGAVGASGSRGLRPAHQAASPSTRAWARCQTSTATSSNSSSCIVFNGSR